MGWDVSQFTHINAKYINEPIVVDLECTVVHLARAGPDVHPVGISANSVLE